MKLLLASLLLALAVLPASAAPPVYRFLNDRAYRVPLFGEFIISNSEPIAAGKDRALLISLRPVMEGDSSDPKRSVQIYVSSHRKTQPADFALKKLTLRAKERLPEDSLDGQGTYLTQIDRLVAGGYFKTHFKLPLGIFAEKRYSIAYTTIKWEHPRLNVVSTCEFPFDESVFTIVCTRPFEGHGSIQENEDLAIAFRDAFLDLNYLDYPGPR